MSLSFPIGEAEIAPEMDALLVEARRLQIERFRQALTTGWSVAEDVREKYRRLSADLSDLSESERRSAYQELFLEFRDDVESCGGFPIILNDLDQMTLFGEVCCGERTGERGVASKRSGTVH